jgi:transposase
MDKPIIDDELWKRIEPLLPQPKPRREKYPGRKPVPDRAALSGILLSVSARNTWKLVGEPSTPSSKVLNWMRPPRMDGGQSQGAFFSCAIFMDWVSKVHQKWWTQRQRLRNQ